MLLKTVPSSRVNKPDHEIFINIVPSTPVNIVIVNRGSVDATSGLCETLWSSHSQSRRKYQKREH